MNCNDWEERLSLYAGGDLPLGQAEEVERHLAECPGCQVFASGLKSAQQLLREAHCEELTPAHFAAVRARVLAELERRRRPLWQRGWAYGLASAAALVLTILAIRPVLQPEVQPPEVAMAHPASPVLTPPAPTPGAAPLRTAQRAHPKGQPGEPVVIRVVSNDPDVLIYWITESRGE